jgi:cold shock CspA family protein
MDAIVSRWFERKGFGFATPLVGRPDEVEDIFVHISQIRGGAPPPVGARISCKVTRSDRGVQAYDVTVKQVKMKCNNMEAS